MKDELLKRGDFNVIIVNWTDSNGRPYPQAVANGRVVGAQTAKLIELLMNSNFYIAGLILQENKGLRAEDVHIIGHSLGGQVSGWAGERIKGIGRITGLDPAGPFFQHAPNKVRLDKTDARFIDVIHTNGGGTYIEGLGIREAIGDLDFYPNGGNRQPGCSYQANHYSDPHQVIIGILLLTVESYVANSCDHGRANEFFVDSINRCTFIAVQCDDYRSFENGECDKNSRSVMGLGTRKLPDLRGSSLFFLNTDDESPFCINGTGQSLHK
ncbi:pancreatic lipase-related protein 3 [Caerostris darwini]|uniref:Pancreatic lipase-related protein 3 n=1 Tax=Caerostris darwini TaxID=1538125 RepID=A0AAV4T7U1_9ARAC|nr:pancreatic lipase-related protein 3 [Caerostris darwini]